MWISKSERLPKAYSYVITLAKDGYIGHSFYAGNQELDDWDKEDDPILYWMYYENPRDMPGIELADGYRGFYGLADEYRASEMRDLIMDQISGLSGQLADLAVQHDAQIR